MALIVWDNSLSVGIPEIDREHQKLINMINELHTAMNERRSKDVLTRIIGGLVAYTKIHFATEERYFARYNYPDAAAHKREHAEFIEKVGAFQRDFESGKLMLSLEVMRFLTGWLGRHIKGTDMKYAQHFAAEAA